LQFQNFNDKCKNELREMNETRINNIIEAGGVDGWAD
jgi:hypothetical protein